MKINKRHTGFEISPENNKEDIVIEYLLKLLNELYPLTKGVLVTSQSPVDDESHNKVLKESKS